MVNRTDSEPATDRLPTHLLPTERSTGLLDTPAYRPTCPDGHGDLVDDGTAPSCPRCGRTDSTGTTMLANLLNPDLARFNQPLQLDPDTTSATRTREITPVRPHNSAQPDEPAPGHADVATHTEPAPSPTPRPVEDHPTEQFGIVREPLGKLHSATTRDELVDPDERDHPTPDLTTRARGTRRDGTIRTTGWLQIGTHPISSGLWAALAGAAAGFAAPTSSPWPALVLAALAWFAWFATTRWLRPASPARNRERLPAEQLQPDTPIRIHGPIGPVGVVDETTRTGQHVHIRFIGGTQRTTTADATCHVVELDA